MSEFLVNSGVPRKCYCFELTSALEELFQIAGNITATIGYCLSGHAKNLIWYNSCIRKNCDISGSY